MVNERFSFGDNSTTRTLIKSMVLGVGLAPQPYGEYSQVFTTIGSDPGSPLWPNFTSNLSAGVMLPGFVTDEELDLSFAAWKSKL